jgi:uracil-DNA glycosylase family 4
VVGESLGREEYLHGYPFFEKAQAGSAIERAIKLSGYDSDDFRFWNIVACQPPDNRLEGTDYGREAIAHCASHFNGVLSVHINSLFRIVGNKPSATILALGNVPLKVLTGVSGNAKEKQSVGNLRGYPIPSLKWGGIPVVSSYHPSFIRRGNPNLFPSLMDDIGKAVDISNGNWKSYKGGRDYTQPSYEVKPSLADAEAFYYGAKDNQGLPLGVDIETPNTKDLEEDEREELTDKDIILVQFSLGKHKAIALPFRDSYIAVIQRLLMLDNVKLGFNFWSFDQPRLEAAGIKIKGLPHDLMWMFRCFQSGLRRNLQNVASYARFPFPWKHLYGSNLEWYGCADVDALQYIWEWLPKEMQSIGCWQEYVDHIYGYYPILERSRVPVDNQARLSLAEELKGERTELYKELEKLIPIESRAIGPRRKDKKTGEVSFGYVRVPTELRQLHKGYWEKRTVLEAKGRKVIEFRDYAALKGFIPITSEDGVNRWAKVKPLKLSKDQVKRYMQWKVAKLLEESN